MFKMIVGILFFLLLASDLAKAQDPALSDSEARRIFDELENSGSIVSLSYGPANVVGGPAGGTASNKCGSGRINANELRVLQAAEKAGLLTIQEDPSAQAFRQGQNFSWNQMLNMTTSGVQTRVLISLTPIGVSLDQTSKLLPDKRIPNCLRYINGSYKAEKVVKNEVIKKGISMFRIISLTYSADWNKYDQAINEQLGINRKKERKARLLWKYDEFQSKWLFQAGDYTNRDADFTTNHVASVLAQTQ